MATHGRRVRILATPTLSAVLLPSPSEGGREAGAGNCGAGAHLSRVLKVPHNGDLGIDLLGDRKLLQQRILVFGRGHFVNVAKG